MTRLRHSLLPALLVTAVAPVVAVAQSARPLATDWPARLARYAAALDSAGFHGVLLTRAGKSPPVRIGIGFADDAGSVPNSAAIAFDIGSLSKQFTAAAILRLEAAGQLQVSDSIGHWLPGVPADKRGITIHHLLTHTSGLPPAIGPDYEPVERDVYIRRALGTPLRSAPGAAYEYSNVGYSLLAAIIEIRSGSSYDVFLRHELFDPAGMSSTGYRVPGLDVTRIATGFDGERRWGRPTEQRWAPDGPFWNLRGNGGILSTADDMLRWHDALAGARILDSTQQRRMYTRYVEEGAGSGSHYGYGWAIFPTPRGTTLITHNGGNGIFFADFLRYLDDDVVIFVATSRMRREFRDVARNVARLVFDPTFTPASPRPPAATRALTTLPETDVGRLVARLLEAVRRNERALTTRVVELDYAPDLVRAASLEQHVGMVERLHQAIGVTPAIRQVVVTEEEVRVTLARPDGRPIGTLLVSVIRAPSGEWKIAGLALED